MVKPFSLLTDFDIALYQSGKHFRLYEKMGSHVLEHEGRKGVYFAVWAPNALEVSVTGDFNGWNPTSPTSVMTQIAGTTIWQTTLTLTAGDSVQYKFFKNNS